jgi:hypothetical protein
MVEESAVRVAPTIDMYADGGCSESCELYETVVSDDQ